MSTHLRNDEDELLDSDPTDELPVLIEAAAVDADSAGETGELDVLDRTWSGDVAAGDGSHGADLIERSALEALQRDLDELAQRATAGERELLDKSAAIAALDSTLADSRRALAAAEAHAVELRDTLAARDTELDGLHAEIAAVRAERDAAHAALAATPTPDRRLQAARDEAAALATYIENRRAHWDALEARCMRQERRIAELELEVEQRRKRQRAAEEAAASETAQAIAWRAELAAALRDRERNGARTAAVGAALAESPAPADPGLERAGRELTEAYGRLAQTRNDLVRLERMLADRDRALAAREERIGQLERELAVRFAPPPATPGAAGRPGAPTRGAPAPTPTPAPTQLTPAPGSRPAAAVLVAVADPPRRYPIGKAVVTIGRSSQCDIQVLTQFVSREHARLVVDAAGVIVEDAGSTNGVFVNAARIERQVLVDGDVLTIGETQFRYMEATP